MTYDQLVAALLRTGATRLLEGGADVLLVETIFDSLNSKAALFAIAKLIRRTFGRDECLVMLSFTITDLERAHAFRANR